MATVSYHVGRFLLTKHNSETKKWYAKYLRPMVEYLGEELTLDAVSRREAEDYWLDIQGTDTCCASHPSKPSQQRALSPITLRNHLRAARTFWNEMVRQQLVEYNPSDHLSAPRDTRPVEMKAVTAEDLRAIWNAARKSSKRDFAIVTVMATTGMRAGELVSMDVQRLDLKHSIAGVEGKRGWRKVFLGESSQKAILNYLCERPKDGPSALWLSVHKRALTSDGVRQMFERLAQKANVQGRYNLHAFRHRVAQTINSLARTLESSRKRQTALSRSVWQLRRIAPMSLAVKVWGIFFSTLGI